MPSSVYRHYGCRIINDLCYKGIRTVFLENELIRVGILLDKGADFFLYLVLVSIRKISWLSMVGSGICYCFRTLDKYAK